jgi:hypothetical protein
LPDPVTVEIHTAVAPLAASADLVTVAQVFHCLDLLHFYTQPEFSKE